MGCTRFVWNAKCEEQEYFYRFKTKFCFVTMKVPIDQSYAQFKNQETTPWLYACPSVLLRNTMCTFKETFIKFLKGECGTPKKKRKGQRESLWFTSELFRFDGNRLFLGGQKFNLGELKFKAAQYTSQECADCGHIHPDSRESQAVFRCAECGHADNADANAAKVIKKRAIKLILDPGTGLSESGVLLANRYRAPSLRKTEKAETFSAISDDVSKKTNEAVLLAA